MLLGTFSDWAPLGNPVTEGQAFFTTPGALVSGPVFHSIFLQGQIKESIKICDNGYF